MNPTHSHELLNGKDKSWPDDHFFIQARFHHENNGPLVISTDKEMSAVALNPKIRDSYPDAANLPVMKELQDKNNPFSTSLISGTAYLSVTTLDDKTPRYYTLRRDAGAPIAAGFLTTASGFAGEAPLQTIAKEANEECGLFYVDPQTYTLKHVAFADIAYEQSYADTLSVPMFFSGTSDDSGKLDRSIWQNRFDKQKDIVGREINKHYPQFSDIDLSKTEPVLAKKIDSELYTPVWFYSEVPVPNKDDHSEFLEKFNAFAYYQEEFNALNLGLVYHIDLPCESKDVIAIDKEPFGRDAKLMTVDELSAEDKKLSFLTNYISLQHGLIENARARNLEVLQPL